MQKFLLVTVSFLAIALLSRPAECGETLPSANDVFDAYVRGLGGNKALNRLNTVERIGMITNEYAQGRFAVGPYHTCVRYPDRVAIEIDAGSWQLAQALKAEGAFECGARFQTCKPASADLSKQLADTARNANKDLLSDVDKWRQAVVSVSDSGTAWRLTRSDGKARWAEFDRSDGSLQWFSNGDRVRRFGNWYQVEGILIPLRLEDYSVEKGQRAWRSTVHLSEVRVTNEPSTWCTERFGKN